MEANNPGYYAIIPAEVRYDETIPANAKLLYGEISALIGSEGYCFASNEYLADRFKMTHEAIARLITKLEKAGHIKRVIEKENGQIVARKLYLRVSVPDGWGIDQKINTSQPKNQEGIDQKINYTDKSNTKKEKDKKEKLVRLPQKVLSDDEMRTLVVECISQLATPDWSASVKNDLYRWVMALYDPEREVRKARPVRSALSVKGTFRKLALSGDDPKVMIGMLCTAIEGGWQGVQVPLKSISAEANKPAKEEREYRCL